MTQQEKQLLLVDLCARLPHHLKCVIDGLDGCILQPEDLCDFIGGGFEIKPYLRPLSSMTEEEKELLRLEHEKDEHLFTECIKKSKLGDNSMRGKVITHFGSDWCNKYHFDYRGLIPMDLALEAPEGMYDTKE